MLTIEKLKEIINSLAQSQGSYGRIKENLDRQDKWEELLKVMQNNNIKDAISLVMFLEG